ncbi:MAG TPA: T9SS type A sorting domain-containing protein [Candidatus Eisenbacteria bacterium]|nr:T9SS type A sorting domain-containing protein [Candidatus Eisenbacteria bacterium]
MTFCLALVLVGLLVGNGPAMAAMAPLEHGDQGQDARGGSRDHGRDVEALASGIASASTAIAATGHPFRSNAYPTFSQPRTVTAADLNLDGYADLIVPTNGTNRTHILFGNASGLYSTPLFGVQLLGSAFNAQKAAVGDFNADGLPDIAVVHYFDGVDVWLQNLDGTFGDPFQPNGIPNATLAAGGTFSRCVAVGDMNADGAPDLAVVSETSVIRVWLAPGAAGSWTDGGIYDTGGSTSSWLVLADMNEDGKLDAVVTNDIGSNTVSILFGVLPTPGAMFGLPATHPTGSGPNTCAVGDLNGDSHLDVAVASWDNVGTVSVHLGTGTGHLLPAVTTAPRPVQESEPFAVAVGDVTGDGNPDVVVANGVGGTVAVHPGDGTGAIGAPLVVGTGYAARGIDLLDANQDGRLDVATSNLSSNTVSVLTADGSGDLPGDTFPAGNDTPASLPFDDRFSGSLAYGDFNNDGHEDLVSTHATAGTVSVALGDGAGAFGTPADFEAGKSPQSIVSADFDANGTADLAVANRGGGNVHVLYGRGDGTFKKSGFGVGSDPADIAAADVNGDGRLDLVTANLTDNSVSVLLKTVGGAGFKSRINSATHAGPKGVAAGDLNGDGMTDLAVADSLAGGFSVLHGNGDGTFQAPLFFFTSGTPVAIATGNWDQAGLPDIALCNTAFNRTEVWTHNGFGYTKTFQIGTFGDPREVLGRDINDDGWLDVVVCSRLGNTFVLLPYEPTPPLGVRRWIFGTPGTSVAVLDANEDGSPDLVTLNARSQSFNVLLNDLVITPLLAAEAVGGPSAAGVREVSLSPNPMNPSSVLRFTVERPGSLKVRLFDVHGRAVRTILEESQAVLGPRRVTIDGSDDQGRRLSSGVYYLRIENAGTSTSGRLTLLK